MNKFFAIIILTISLQSFSQSDIKYSNKKLTETELEFVKENYNWNSEEFIIINFRQPRNKCHYDNYKNLKKSSK